MLAVDYGTTNTVAAIGDANGVRTLTVDGKTVLPSAVLLDVGFGHADRWLVGETAINMARRRMEWFESSPKRWIADGSLFLGDRDVPVMQAVAAVLRVVVDEAAQQQGRQPPAVFVVTHPASWPESRVAVLREAARVASAHRGGWPAAVALAEPVAAARRMVDVVGLPERARVVVLDMGGGTTDVAVIDLTPDPAGAAGGSTVVGRPTGIEDTGGEDFDLRLARRMTEEAGAPGLYDRLAESSNIDDRERAVDIRRTARLVKEQLSRQSTVPSSLPKAPPELPADTPVQISRDQLEELIRGGAGNEPGLADAVVLATDALADAPPGGPPLAGVYLVGGSSRIPLLGTLVQQHTSRPPITGGDPSTAVADGAALHALELRTPTPPPPPPPDRARVLRLAARTAVAAMLAAGALVGILTPGGNGCAVAAAGSECPSPTITNPVPSTASQGPDPTLAACPTADGVDCRERILARSHAAWPMLPDAGCTVRDSLYGPDRYAAECRTSTTTYLVFWRASGSIVEPLAGQMQMPTVDEFELSQGAAALGSQVKGTRPTGTGTRFTCAWEYRDFPVTMVLDGPNEDATLALCGTATFLDAAGLRSALDS